MQRRVHLFGDIARDIDQCPADFQSFQLTGIAAGSIHLGVMNLPDLRIRTRRRSCGGVCVRGRTGRLAES